MVFNVSVGFKMFHFKTVKLYLLFIFQMYTNINTHRKRNAYRLQMNTCQIFSLNVFIVILNFKALLKQNPL